MITCMRTTIRLDEALLREARTYSAARGRTFTSLVEEAIRAILRRPATDKGARIELPVSKASGGTLPGVDLDDASALLDTMDGRG